MNNRMLEFKHISRSGHGKGLDIEFEVMVKLWPVDWDPCSFVKAQLSIKVRIHSRFLSHIKGMFYLISFLSFLLPHINNKSITSFHAWYHIATTQQTTQNNLKQFCWGGIIIG